jgi:hypothetical protein
MTTRGFKERSPFIVRTGSSSSFNNNTPPPSSGVAAAGKYTFCSHCGGRTFYWPQHHGLWCNLCGTLEEDSEQLKAQLEIEQLEQQSTFSLADGTDVYSPENYTYSKLRQSRRTFPVGSGGGGSGAKTISMKDTITDKLHMKDGRSREMDRIFQQQDRQMEATGKIILEDRLELKRSSNVTSSDELRAENSSGNVGGISGTGKYNPATRRRTRLSF